MATAFTKMHGLGNDFVVVDARTSPLRVSSEWVRRLADRRRGVGCDQVVTIEAGEDGEDAVARFFNAEGSEAEACGNGVRCVALLLLEEVSDRNEVRIGTASGLVTARFADQWGIVADLPAPRFDWRNIPLVEERDTLDLGISCGPLAGGTAVNVGNPHVVFVVNDANAVNLESLGPQIENMPLFPERTNVEVVTVLAPDRLRMRVWERGVGITEACGSGACAALVATSRLARTGRAATVVLDGGELDVEWLKDDRIRMAGEALKSFQGELPGVGGEV